MITKKELDDLLDRPIFLFEKYHKKSKIKKAGIQISLTAPKEWQKVYFKFYPRCENIILPNPSKFLKMGLSAALHKRKSCRNFGDKKLSLDILTNLLYYSSGLKNKRNRQQGNRFYPSGGARYPLELYVISTNTELPNGIYHYLPLNHSLELLNTQKKIKISDFAFQPWTHKAAVLIVISAIFSRSSVKYRESAYRYSLLEAGHLGQNISLVSEALDCGCLALGGILEEKLERILDIDGMQESIVYTFAVGNKSSTNI